ncbi:TIGR03826 family flagellar region protein [Pseudoneobacillus rhizosphaerae]|uniref:Flagellar protein n=1 Tax=Pseudoneobacillus rhizosphaerae TaxID=2880968 RepID=A0A9C7GC20_9BACI|nr:TIGR03826 family flagellar region protein [Pseudoneobacillus rhizosphaerae]CAG9609749.1 hypothetical protein NEOCIP111885_03492 [Pseudoneobacillus rhizosphaerae]
MTNLGNCVRCGKLFLKIRDICQDCYQKQEDNFVLVNDYLRNHKNGTIQEVSEETGVSIAQIRQFILAKRIQVNYFPNLTYPCDTCGSQIKEGKNCQSCMVTINELSKQVEKSLVKEEKTTSHAYKTRM